MAIKRKWMPSPCYHSRGGITPYKIVLHTAEGATTIESLGNFFANGANQVSSHTGADDKKNIIGEYVTRGNAAWTAAAYNEESVQLELCGFAAWSRSAWLNHHSNMIDNAAAWVREEADRYGIPIVALNNSQAQGGGRGVCQHVNLGSGGGGHVDCGSGFPMDELIKRAKGGSASADEPGRAIQLWEEWPMFLVFDQGNPDASEAPACTLAIPNELSRGKHKIRFACRRDADIRVLTTAGKSEVHIEAQGGMSVGIPDGCRTVTVKLDSDQSAPGVPISPISAAISEN
jgi:hypothetical protein